MAELKELSNAVAEFSRDLGAVDVPLGESSWSRMQALSGYVRSKLHEAIHLRVKRALAVVSSHYEINLERVCEGYILLRPRCRGSPTLSRIQARHWRFTLRLRWFRRCRPLLSGLTTPQL